MPHRNKPQAPHLVLLDQPAPVVPPAAGARVMPFPALPDPITAAEVAEYRALLPRLKRMLEDWELATSCSGCPVLHDVLRDRELLPPANK